MGTPCSFTLMKKVNIKISVYFHANYANVWVKALNFKVFIRTNSNYQILRKFHLEHQTLLYFQTKQIIKVWERLQQLCVNRCKMYIHIYMQIELITSNFFNYQNTMLRNTNRIKTERTTKVLPTIEVVRKTSRESHQQLRRWCCSQHI